MNPSNLPMAKQPSPRVVIVDYRVGNLFSVRNACVAAGLEVTITAEKRAILDADAVIVPGVGAFGDAMDTLRRLDLVRPLQDLAAVGTPLFGICLGMQLFMSESEEFGHHRGLGLFEGPVVRFDKPRGPTGELKVPQVGWNRIFSPRRAAVGEAPAWANSPLAGVAEGDFMYFVHSFYAQPVDPAAVLAVTRYGGLEFCSSLRRGNVFACQFHPERSGATGLRVYQNIARDVAAHAAAARKNYVR
jgi:glutamine amidotransferase